jgi:3',5'-cyclic-AMP phosphodiesterase
MIRKNHDAFTPPHPRHDTRKPMKQLLVLICIVVISSCSTEREPSVVKFGICADAHLNLMHDAPSRLGTFMAAMEREKPDFIIELGDFTPPDERAAAFFEIWNGYEGEKYHVIGNHETDGGYPLQQVLAMRGMSRSYYAFDKKGIHFIVLDGNDRRSPESKPYFRFVGPVQVNWLKRDLAESVHPVVVFSHQELFCPSGETDMGIENHAEIREIFRQHNLDRPGQRVIACFNGHTHFDYAEQIDGIWYLTVTSMAYHWLGEGYTHVRYGEDIDREFPFIKYTAPFAEPLYAAVEISTAGFIRVSGRSSEWVGPSPWDLGYPERFKKYMRPGIADRYLEFSL